MTRAKQVSAAFYLTQLVELCAICTKLVVFTGERMCELLLNRAERAAAEAKVLKCSRIERDNYTHA